MFDVEYLRKCLESKRIFFEFYRFDKETVTSTQASKLLKVPLTSIAKSVLLMSENKEPVLVILPGYKRIPQKRLARVLGKKKLRLATKEEVLHITGYPAGGIPPFFHKNKILTIVDKELMNNEYVIAGGGDTKTLLKVNIRDVVMIQNAKVLDI
ncbi:MAG: aminoacyl-tRNA deacylase [Thermoproteales archaeon]|nr:aminoacyl-tRNA deacylase [Thermoproteales archaeon]